MKWIFLFSILVTSSAFGISHKEFVKLSRSQREFVVKEYRNFLGEYSKKILLTENQRKNFWLGIESAHAAGELNCFFAGWPSSTSGGKCSTPRSNPAYQRETSCGQNKMPCQPLLFGRGICVSNETQAQRNSAFANCEREAKPLAQVVEYLSDPQVSQEADELFRLVDQICAAGEQASICRKLHARVEEIKGLRNAPAARTAANAGPSPAMTATSTAPDALTVSTGTAALNAVTALNTTARCETCEAMRAQTTDEAPPIRRSVADSSELTPYPRITSGYNLASCGSGQGTNDGYNIRSVFDCQNGSARVPSGFMISQSPDHPLLRGLQTPYPGGGRVSRMFEMMSVNNAFNETYMILEESAGGPDSHNVKSYMFIIPRVTVPSIERSGENLIMTLPTGETVTVDKNTGAITGGALTEGPIDMNTDRFQRKPPNINYSGTGISIRLNHRFEHPLTSAESATVKQGNRSCNVPRTALFDSEGVMKSQSDAELVAVLNRSCPVRRGQTPFSI